jgi:hypothetical protein
MIGDFQSLEDFPPWAWPYINVARLAKGERASEEVVLGAQVPSAAIGLHMHQILTAAVLQQVASVIGDPALKKELSSAASALMLSAIDDCGNGRPKPWPRPPRRHEMFEVAAHLAIAAAEAGDEALAGSLAGAVEQLAAQANEA